MAAAEPLNQPAEVASKVLRRAQVSKMARALQDHLALANIKIKNGWENISLDVLEPRIDLELKRKRPGSSNGAMSDTSSSVSERYYSRGTIDSSPLTIPMFSDDRSGSSYGSRKKVRYQSSAQGYPASSNHNRVRVKGVHNKSSSWKSNYRLPESSPAYHNRHVRYSDSHMPRLSFISEASTTRDGSKSPGSEQDDEDLPVMSFHNNRLNSSPPMSQSTIPRTPSPDIARSARLRSKPFPNEHTKQNGEEGADLLMFLAASPSPAVPKPARTPRTNAPPSTPPPKHTPLPSSMMNTPGGSNNGFLGFGAATPGANFNFSDYLNVTPSPAQAAWRTPRAGKTPLVASTRRRLNFDNLMPPTTGDSPRIGHDTKLSGLGMELGGELVSSQ